VSKQQAEELLSQIEIFLGMGLASLLVAALYWHGNTKGGWGNNVDWGGRVFDSVVILVFLGFSLWRKKVRCLYSVLLELLALFILWLAFWLDAIALWYGYFFGIFIFLLGYSVVLSVYYLWSNLTGKVCAFLDKVVNIAVGARRVSWLALLLLGTIMTWSEIRNHVTGSWTYIVLIVCGLVVGVLILSYVWLTGIGKARNNT
jgi:hypothetical protein